jgi:hypothetical protein
MCSAHPSRCPLGLDWCGSMLSGKQTSSASSPAGTTMQGSASAPAFVATSRKARGPKVNVKDLGVRDPLPLVSTRFLEAAARHRSVSRKYSLLVLDLIFCVRSLQGTRFVAFALELFLLDAWSLSSAPPHAFFRRISASAGALMWHFHSVFCVFSARAALAAFASDGLAFQIRSRPMISPLCLI